MSKSYKVLLPCAYPYIPWLMAQGLHLNGHRPLGLNCSAEDGFFKEVDRFQPDFILVFSTPTYDPTTEFGDKFLNYCARKSLPVITFDADHPALGNYRTLFERVSEPPLRSLMHYVSLAEGWAKAIRKYGLKAEPLFMVTDHNLGQVKVDHSIHKHDLVFSGRPLDFHLLKEMPSVRVEQPSELELKISHSAYAADILEQAFEKLTHEPSEVSSQMEAAKAIIQDYFEQPILSPDEFQKTYEESLKKARVALKEPFFEAFDRGFLMMSVAHSNFKHAVALKSLLPRGLKIFGPDWNRVLQLDSSFESRFPNREEFYKNCAESRIYFCHHKDQMMDAINPRVLEIIGAGGFALSDHREGFDQLFEKNEVVTYRSLEEANEKIDYYLTHESQRLQVIERGRKRFLESYTSRGWVKRLLEIMHDKWGII